ncbi:hypothetical protein, partial [Novacetimonas hansenii]|uniref:hypothetical protein n=1 Tax=Novacetimonas hansenii TaxID=436 RepID=UPI001FF1EDF7
RRANHSAASIYLPQNRKNRHHRQTDSTTLTHNTQNLTDDTPYHWQQQFSGFCVVASDQSLLSGYSPLLVRLLSPGLHFMAVRQGILQVIS